MEVQISQKELEIAEHLCDPTSLTENLIPLNENAPQTWDENADCIYLRPYQFVMQNYSYIYAYDPEKEPVENTRIKKSAGDLYSIGARNTGKSFFLKIDTILSVVHRIVQGCVASFDAKHLKKVADGIADYMESHSFLQIFHCRDTRKNTVRRDPLTISTEHGSLIKSVNEKVEGNNPGVGYHGLHYDTRWYEEYSYASKEGEEKTVDAVNSLGHIDRPSGIPDLCVGSPLGKILKDKSKRPWIWKLPQYVREDWNEQTEKERIEFYKGKNSAAYKLNVEAETIEGAFGFWDMARLKEASLNERRDIKFFEIGKDTYTLFDKMLIVERLVGAEQVFICADIGFGAAPTEIIIIFFNGKRYIYEYNISLFRLTQEEQAEILYFLYEKMGGAFISIDATSDEGVTLDFVYKKGVPIEHLLKVKFNANIEVGFELDEKDNPIIDKSGDTVMKMANTREWAFQELPQLMYSGKMDIPLDTKFLNQFTNTIMQKTKAGKPLYSCKGENHLHSAFEVFAICRFINEFKTLKNNRRTQTRCYGVFSDGEVI